MRVLEIIFKGGIKMSRQFRIGLFAALVFLVPLFTMVAISGSVVNEPRGGACTADCVGAHVNEYGNCGSYCGPGGGPCGTEYGEVVGAYCTTRSYNTGYSGCQVDTSQTVDLWRKWKPCTCFFLVECYGVDQGQYITVYSGCNMETTGC